MKMLLTGEHVIGRVDPFEIAILDTLNDSLQKASVTWQSKIAVVVYLSIIKFYANEGT
jgi:hypothetical protein